MDPRYSTTPSGGFNQRYVSDFYSPSGNLTRRGGMGAVYILLITLILALVLSLIIWLIWYKPLGVTLGEFIIIGLKSLIDIILWPFKFILQV